MDLRIRMAQVKVQWRNCFMLGFHCSKFLVSWIINSCWKIIHSVQNILSSRLHSKNINIKTHQLRDGQRLKEFWNRTSGRICGPKRDEVAGGWIRLHNEELHNLYASPNIIRVIKCKSMRGAGHTARMDDKYVQNFGQKTWREEDTWKTYE